MERKKTDRRVLYTKMVLRDSLLELMKEKSIEKITPTELCRKADINRNTFYSHYYSPMELLKSIEDEIYDKVEHSLDITLQNDDITGLLTEICMVIYDNKDLCRVLFSKYGDKDFLERIVNLAHDKSVEKWKQVAMEGKEELLEDLYTYLVNGSMAVIQKWTQTDMKKSPEEIADFIEKVTNYGLQIFKYE